MAVFAGVDYHQILRRAEAEADIVIWDGGNNDLPFIKSDMHIVLVDPHYPGDETTYHPGEANLCMAELVIINRADSASAEHTAKVQSSVSMVVRENVPVLLADSIVSVGEPKLIKGQRALVVGDGPTLTHGGMAYGAGTIAARDLEAAEIVFCRQFPVGSIKAAYEQYPQMENEVPALGYNPGQLADLEATLNASYSYLVLDATPVNLSQLITVNKPMIAAEYEMREWGGELNDILADFDYQRITGG